MLEDKIREPLAKWLDTCLGVFNSTKCDSIEYVVKESYKRGYIDGYYSKASQPSLIVPDEIELPEYQGPYIYKPILIHHTSEKFMTKDDNGEYQPGFVNAVYGCEKQTPSYTFIYRFSGIQV